MKLSQKLKSIGFRTSIGMALLLISVVLVASVGIRGIGSLTGAVSQTVDTSKVLIGANKAEGAIIQYLISKEPQRIDQAASALQMAQATLNSLKLSKDESAELSNGISMMSNAVRSLATSQDAVQKAGAALREATGSMVTLADQAEKSALDVANQAETNSNNALISLNTIRILIQNTGSFREGINAVELALVKASAQGGVISADQIAEPMARAQTGLTEVVKLGGTPDIQPIVSSLESTFTEIEAAISKDNGAALSATQELGLFAQISTTSQKLEEVLRMSAEKELAAKSEKDTARSKARIISGTARNFSNVLKDILVQVERYHLQPSAEADAIVTANLKKAAGLGAMLAKISGNDMTASLAQLGQTFEAMKTNLASFDQQASLVVSTSQSVTDGIVAIAGEIASKSELQGSQGTSWMWSAGLFSFVLAMAIAFFMVRSVARPMVKVAQAMARLAKGETDTHLELAKTDNEIGEMIGALQVFQQNDRARLNAEAEADRGRQQAEILRHEREAERVTEAQAMEHAFGQISTGLDALSKGDLTARIGAVDSRYERIRTHFNSAVSTLEEAIDAVIVSVGTIRSGLSEISSASNDLARRTEQQAASLEETVAALGEVSNGITSTADGADHAQKTVALAKTNAEGGGAVVERAISAMSEIQDSSAKIGNIIGVIDEIAFQTNLLALNAGVEAARAGDAGKGFAVVAQEVRELAQRSANAAREIKGLISTSTTQVAAGVKLVDETGISLKDICEQVGGISSIIDKIAMAAREQSVSLREVSNAGDEMDKVTQQNAAMVEETTAASQTLVHETEMLAQMVGQFATRRSSGARMRAAA
ncbi:MULTISPECIES: HAMP domain-containing methyl-accepting chemotaxis protein [unclassified Rhizobium]|uniref:methyl-accepting chemotaxis protein n=1 Tax=unclassified Rhizobium TaxID=2613769 RepID=UPI00288948A1|nr:MULTISPECIES: HAMP domain-containing methyl-accepting chemotaxis protein [unclassified Rhizobium]